MILFTFSINSSFLNESAHPITIPKSQFEYKTIEEYNFDLDNITVIFPRGEKMTAHLYTGTAGYGSYYQLRFHAQDGKLPSYLKLKDDVAVIICRVKGKTYSFVECLD